MDEIAILESISERSQTPLGWPEKSSGAAESGELVFVRIGAENKDVRAAADVKRRRSAQDQRQKVGQPEWDLAHTNRLSLMGELAASLAHEITQPIATARNNARAALNFLAKAPPDLREVREALGCIVDDADRAGQIIDRIREHIKKAPPRHDDFDLKEAIDEVIGLTRSALANNRVSVQTHSAEGPLAVNGDRVQVQQVVLNLVLNAVEAMSTVDDGVRELSLGAERRGTNGVLVAVRDSGPGTLTSFPDPHRPSIYVQHAYLAVPFHLFAPSRSQPVVCVSKSSDCRNLEPAAARPPRGPGRTR